MVVRGLVAHAGRRRNLLGKRSPARFVVEKPASAYAEALRSTFTAITLGMLDQPPRVVMVTSSLPSEGKSTFACSLAGLMARSNPQKKVVVVDCDLRRSSVAATLGVPKDEGWLFSSCVCLGYPTGRWGVAARRPVQEVSFRNRWGAPVGFEVDAPLWSPDGR